MTDQAAVPTVGMAVVPVAVPAAPVAKRVHSERTHHGDTVVDDYAWLADKTDPDTIAYLTAENEYTAARTHDQAPLREAIFNEIKSRTQETDLTVPTRHAGYWYYTRTVEGQQYAIHCRRAVAEGELAPPATDDGGPLEGEEILLDGNAEAAGSEFFAMGTFDVSPDTHLLAYSVDLTGDERFTLRVKDLRTGAVLPDEVSNVFYGSAWSLDASSLFYLTVDEAWRPYRVWRHAMGTPASEDVLVYEEPDERFWVGVGLTRSEQFIVIDAHSKVTSEVRLIPAAAPAADPVVVAPRRQGVEYNVEHDPGADRLLVLHNDGAEDFALAVTSATAPGAWTPLVPHASGVRLLDVDAFVDHIVVSLRRDGLTALRVLPREGEPFDISFPEPIHTVGLGENPEYATTTIRLHYASLITPDSVYDYDLGSRSFTLLKRRPVLGDFDPEAYEQHREWAIAPDGTRVPISLVCRRDVARDGTAPTVLYGYGSYETSMDPWFSVARLSLLDRGVVFAVAHVRGGGELGRRWYTDGRLLAKKNTFTDFVACAQHLAQSGWTSPDRLIARGGSAGGLLMGAVANLAPAAFGGIVAEVPFVDNLSTILDPSLPLTVIEWEEWGNPLADAEAYEYIKSYAPYENVRPAPSPEGRRSSRGKERSAGSLATYPPILAVTSLNDTRVFFHEPAKWIARLRAVAPDGDYLLKTEMEAGHGGRSGRYDAWHEEAFILAWLLTRFESRRS